MSVWRSTALFHLSQIVAIYMPGAALIPAALVAPFYHLMPTIVATAVLTLIIVFGLWHGFQDPQTFRQFAARDLIDSIRSDTDLDCDSRTN